jgi:hypothetical protein
MCKMLSSAAAVVLVFAHETFCHAGELVPLKEPHALAEVAKVSSLAQCIQPWRMRYSKQAVQVMLQPQSA